MVDQSAELLEKLRQQFDTAPYPKIPLEASPQGETKYLYTHDLVVAYYKRNQRVINPAGKIILDAGCGSGYKALTLAEANPGAKIVGVDLSEESVKLARERLRYHGFENAEFYALTVEELPQLGMTFDYINCDEVLYLLSDPVQGMQAMKAVLKPDGMIRANYHSCFQRGIMHQAQEFFGSLGLMEQTPTAEDFKATRDIMKAMKGTVALKQRTWKEDYERDDDLLLANHLLRGDKGITVPQFFEILRQADLEFINMVNWWQWDFVDLFDDFSELPVEIALTLADKSLEEQLHFYELIHPVHRLLDLWCGHPGQSQPYTPIEEWTDDQWHRATVHFYPQLRVPQIKQAMIEAIQAASYFEISRYLNRNSETINLDSLLTATLLPLLDGPQPAIAIAQRWQKLRPLDLITLEPTTEVEAWELLKPQLTVLNQQGHLMIELRNKN
jgi:2-polyprenyl-3-methyl-5-hydroxy-6-metoxy-1,4-benzoquinol methylase